MNADQSRKRTNDLLFALLAEFMEWHTGISPSAEEVENSIVLRKSAPLSVEADTKKAEEKAAKDEADKKTAEDAKAAADKAKASKKAEKAKIEPISPKRGYW